MTSDPYIEMRTGLLALGGQRVWSLMVTLFGDLAQAEGRMIDGPLLSAIMDEIDVRPEAVRVALHRLRKDGWIVSHKHGRTRRHSLTPTSRRETLAASARIYAPPGAQPEPWRLALLPEGPPETPRGWTALLPRVCLGAAGAAPPAGALVLEGTAPPDWLRHEIAAQMLEEEYAALLPLLRSAADALPAGALSPLRTAVLRCLIVHNWRRIVLRHPALPPALLPDDWAGHACHVLVAELLARFPVPPPERITAP